MAWQLSRLGSSKHTTKQRQTPNALTHNALRTVNNEIYGNRPENGVVVVLGGVAGVTAVETEGV
jgi:hypothetical protein